MGARRPAIDDKKGLVPGLAEARAAWPTVHVDDATFAAYVAERVRADDTDVSRLHLPDLYLACGCAHGDGAAVAAFTLAFERDLRAILARPGTTGVDTEDLVQRVATHLLTPDGDRPPRITEYRGRGTLRSWLRVVAVRMRLNAGRGRAARHDPLPAQAEERLATDLDPELDYLKEHYRAAFREALAKALDALEPRERNLLRLQIVHGLSATGIGELHRVHRATAKRWLAQVRLRVLETTRSELMARLKIETKELDSIMAMIGSRLEASVRRWLGDAPE